MRAQSSIAALVLSCAAASALAQPGPDRRPPNDGPPRGDERGPGEGRMRKMEKGAFLGVATSPASPALREQLKLPVGTGLVVDVIEEGSPAAKAGVKEHDVLTKLGDQVLVNAQQLAVLVRGHKPGDQVELTAYRGGDTTKLTATLAEKELGPLEDIFFFHNGARGMMPPGGGMRLELGGPGGEHMAPRLIRPMEPRPGETFSSTTAWTDGEHTLTITATGNPPTRKLVATDKSGAVLFDGNLDDKEARAKMPPDVAKKLERMEAAGIKPPRFEGPRGHGPGDRGPGGPGRPGEGRPPRPEGDRPEGRPGDGGPPPPPPGGDGNGPPPPPPGGDRL